MWLLTALGPTRLNLIMKMPSNSIFKNWKYRFINSQFLFPYLKILKNEFLKQRMKTKPKQFSLGRCHNFFFFFKFLYKACHYKQTSREKENNRTHREEQQALISTTNLNNILHYPRKNSSPHLRFFTLSSQVS